MRKTIILAFLAFISTSIFAHTAQEVLSTIQKCNTYFMSKYEDPTTPTFVNKERSSNLWTRSVYYEGLMNLYAISPEKKYTDYTDKWADFHKWSPRNGINTTNADDQCCGQIYVARFLQTGSKDSTKIKSVIANLDHQMETRQLNYWTWIDAIQMAMPLYAYIYKITGNRKYMNYAMKMYYWSRNECGGGLFNKKTGLWYRDADYTPPYKESDGKDCYWSRGNGWVYAALVKVMNTIGDKDPYYKELKKDYISMSESITSCQRQDGFWNVSLISPATYGGKELTGTSLFLYGISWGIMNGYLKKSKFRPIADKTWNAINECVHEDGFLGWVQGTGKDPSAGQPLSYTKVPDFEDFGTGCFLLGASEYYKLLIKNEK